MHNQWQGFLFFSIGVRYYIWLFFRVFSGTTSCAAVAFGSDIDFRIHPAVELGWDKDGPAHQLAVSADTEEWNLVEPTTESGKKAYWLTSLRSEVAPLKIRRTFKEAPDGEPDNALSLQLAPGVRRVRIENLNTDTGRWDLHLIAHHDGREGGFLFRIPVGIDLGNLRVSTSNQSLFSFDLDRPPGQFGEQILDLPDDEAARGTYPVSFDSNSTTDAEGGDVVVESDIWKLDGSTLYFFNRYRGLQIFNLDDPSDPLLTGSLRLPSVGDQLYVLDSNSIILLANSGGWNEAEVLYLKLDSGQPVITHRFPIPGHFRESRLVGDRLYTATQHYRSWFDDELGYWTSETNLILNAIDFSDRLSPVEISRHTLPEYVDVVTATSEFLILGTRSPGDYHRSNIRLLPIGGGQDDLVVSHEFALGGHLADKFKVQIHDGNLTAISQKRFDDSGRWQLSTLLETFTLASVENATDPDTGDAAPAPGRKLGELNLGPGERLYATRFAGNRVYIVTFFTIDPLWIVDLSDPVHPRVAGELEIPGWSTYLEVLDDQLLAVGVQDRRVTVSLFDVSDPEDPALSDRVFIGEEGSYSWSEANYDEKAVSVIRDAGLVLVPFQSWENGVSRKEIQLIDLNEAGRDLNLRGSIQHLFQPRRAALLENAIVSISAKELMTVDALDRDSPSTLATLSIAWGADRVYSSGEFLVQLEFASPWSGQASIVRLTSKDAPDTVLAELNIGIDRIIGDGIRDGTLHLIRSTEPYWNWVNGLTPEQEPVQTYLTLIDVQSLESLAVLGTLSLPEKETASAWGWSYEPKWLSDDVVVWHSNLAFPSYYYEPYPMIDVVDSPISIGSTDLAFRPWYWSFKTLDLIFVDVADKAQPLLLNTMHIEPENAFALSDVWVAGPELLFSYDTKYRYNDVSVGGYYLQPVDIREPAEPVLRDPLGLPGHLEHVYEDQSGGVLLFTTVYVKDESRSPGYFWERMLQAIAYDGANVYLMDEIELDEGNSGPVAYGGRSAYKSLYSNEAGETGIVPVTFTDAGVFEKFSTIPVPSYAYQLSGNDGFILSRGQNEISLFPAHTNATPTEAIVLPLPYYVWFDLEKVLHIEGEGVWLPSGLYGVEHLTYPDLDLVRQFTPASDEDPSSEWSDFVLDPEDFHAIENMETDWYFGSDEPLQLSPVEGGYSRISVDHFLVAGLTPYFAVELELKTEAGKEYRIQSSTDFVNWETMDTFQGNGERAFRLQSVRDREKKFFRVKVESP